MVVSIKIGKSGNGFKMSQKMFAVVKAKFLNCLIASI